jgi:hypothetical protein
MSGEKEYGTREKIIQFTDTEHHHAQLKVRLHFDGLSQGDFFRAIVKGYNDRHPDIVSYVEIIKNHRRKYSKSERRKVANSYARHEETKKQFGLSEQEIESIFDMIKKEQD